MRGPLLTPLRAFLLLTLLLPSGCQWLQDEIRRPTRYILPEGYAGWVEIEYEVEGAPPLPIEDGQYVAEIGPDGRLVTSSSIDFGTPLRGSDEYVYQESGERITADASQSRVGYWRPTIGRRSIRLDSGDITYVKYEMFFVGTEDQREGWEGLPQPGPLHEVRPD